MLIQLVPNRDLEGVDSRSEQIDGAKEQGYTAGKIWSESHALKSGRMFCQLRLWLGPTLQKPLVTVGETQHGRENR